jgi:CheY-like chemotaxis protein
MPPSILYAEDDPNDIALAELALQPLDIQWQFAADGAQAIAYLSGEAMFSDRNTFPEPQIVLLDVKMPTKPGLEVLAWIRRQPRLAAIPVVMISSSMQESDVMRAYELGANAYLGKPAAFKSLQYVLQGAIQFFSKGGVGAPR